jgi:chemotaxis protein MotA
MNGQDATRRLDTSTLLGLLLAVAGIFGAQWIDGGRVESLVQGTALLMVVAGTIGAVLVQTSPHVFARAVRMARFALFPPRVDTDRLIGRLVDWAQVARRDGALALEARAVQTDDPFTKSGLQMVVDGFAPDHLREALDVELAAREQTQRDAVRVWESAGGYAPTIGIIGAVLGLIHVMENLGDPTRLGAGIAVAFVATVYGLVLANLVLLPIAGKLRNVVAEETLLRELTQEALVAIAAGEHPHLIRARLRGFVPAVGA